MKQKILFFLLLVFFYKSVLSQINLGFNVVDNSHCNGTPCNYYGPKLLINEIMINPRNNNGSIYGEEGTTTTDEGEWVELYNPDSCSSVDVSCFIIGNYVLNDTINHGSSFVFPSGLIVPPNGFVIIRGQNSEPVSPSLLVNNGGNCVDIVVNDLNRICLGGGNRIWLANNGGWLAIYDDNGFAQDAISWGDTSFTFLNGKPCILNLATCNNIDSLASYSEIPTYRKTFISNHSQSIDVEKTLERDEDGSEWDIGDFSNPTLGYCNSMCFDNHYTYCNGTATVNVVGGNPPYQYLWSDPRNQTTKTATELCKGTYSVSVTDFNNMISIGSVEVLDFLPNVNFSLPFQNICLNSAPVNIDFAIPHNGIYSGLGVSNQSFNPLHTGIGIHEIIYNYVDSYNCSNSDTAIINVLDTTLITLFNFNDICVNKEAFELDNAVPSGGEYIGIGIDNNFFFPSTAGVGNFLITYKYTDVNSCISQVSDSIHVFGVPNFKLDEQYNLCEHSYILVNLNDTNYKYLWSNGEMDQGIEIYEQGEYWLKVYRDECISIDTFRVEECFKIFIPKAFTPNNDGVNDYFQVITDDVKFFELNIYSRWGELVFHSIDIEQKWDGTYKGLPCQQGSYNYSIIISNDNKTKKHYTGSIMLLK